MKWNHKLTFPERTLVRKTLFRGIYGTLLSLSKLLKLGKNQPCSSHPGSNIPPPKPSLSKLGSFLIRGNLTHLHFKKSSWELFPLNNQSLLGTGTNSSLLATTRAPQNAIFSTKEAEPSRSGCHRMSSLLPASAVSLLLPLINLFISL